MRPTFPILLALALGAAALPSRALADGVPALPYPPIGQKKPALVADGAGGAWLTFKADDSSRGLVHVLGSGQPDPWWPANFLRPGVDISLTMPSRITADSSGRVFVFADQSIQDTLVAGYGNAGAALPGYPIRAELFYPSPYVLATGGRVFSAVTGGLQLGSGTRVAVLSTAGVIEREVELTSIYQVNSGGGDAVPDGAGGIIVGQVCYTASDYTSGKDLTAVRVSPNGTAPWGNSGVVVCKVNGDQSAPKMAADGSGGVLVSWTDARTSPASSPSDIYASRLTATGAIATGWSALGLRVAAAAGAQTESRIVDDGAGGAWIFWRDQRVADIDLYFTHVLGNGVFAPGFNNQGTLLCGATGGPSELSVVADGAGGFFAAWIDPRTGSSDVYGTHYTAAGAPAPGWPADGLALCDNAAFAETPLLARTGVERAILAWRDLRDTGGRIYTMAIGMSGPLAVGDGPAARTTLRLSAARNPAQGLPELRLASALRGKVTVDLVDLGGRVVRSADVEASSNEIGVRFTGGPLAPGIYFASARQGSERAVLRVCVLR